MSDLVIKEPLASRFREAAQLDNHTPEEMLAIWLERYHPAPRPVSSLTDADIEVPDDIEDKAAYRAAARTLAPKLYRIARRYWAKVGDKQRLALTDEELDKQFWLIDHNGVPRLKSEKGTIELPPDPLQGLIGLIDTDQTDLSVTVRESVAAYFRDKNAGTD
jgi:hypothetical protein